MSNRQLFILLVLNVGVALALAWVIERTTIRNFMAGFEEWWSERGGVGGGHAE